MCILYEVDAVHYLFISPVCLAAIVCTSACLAIIMPHALFKTHAQAESDGDSYTSYLSQICLLIGLLLSQAVENNCRNSVSHKHSLSYLYVSHQCSSKGSHTLTLMLFYVHTALLRPVYIPSVLLYTLDLDREKLIGSRKHTI